MSTLLIQVLATVAGGVLGAGVGYSGVLCADGSCPITGSWYGGAAFGGLLGLAIGGLFIGTTRHG